MAALLFPGTASASNASKPVVLATFPGAECMTTISDAARIRVGIPYEDVGTTPDEAPGSRELQFFATCRDAGWLETLPTWISRAESTTAALYDPTVVPPSPDEVVEEAAAWNGPGHGGEGSPCVIPINAADDRIPISCEETADGVTWDTTDVPPGAYVVWSYTYEGARSSWSPARIVVRVVGDDPDLAPPAVAFSSPVSFGAMYFDSGILVEGCGAGAPGTTLTLSWATTEDLADDPDAAWTELAVQEAGPFSVPFLPPARALTKGVVFRAEVEDPQGRVFSVLGPEYMEVREGCGAPSGGAAVVIDACGVAEDEEVALPAAASLCDEDEEGESSSSEESSGDPPDDVADTDTDTDTDAAMESPQVEQGCACTTTRGNGSLVWLVPVLVWIRRRSLLALLLCGCGGERDGDRYGGALGSWSSAGEDGSGPEGSSDESGHERLDAGGGDEGPMPVACDPDASVGMGGMMDFSYIWIANSPEGTVSKIDTHTGVELARYYTGPTMADDPSRTSVNLRGDVAVSNRNGGIVKIAAEKDRCVDRNGNGKIDTSTGPDDVLLWEDEECHVWHREIDVAPGLATFGSANSQGPRPTAWDFGEHFDPCADDHRVWVGWYGAVAETLYMLRLDGKTGEILDALEEPTWPSNHVPGYGPYGGAVDPSNAMWVVGLGGPLARIDPVTLEVERWDVPSETIPYGIAIDAEGHVWLAALSGHVVHFDPDNEHFDVIAATDAGLRGLQVDREGVLWAAHGVPGGGLGCGLVKVDVATRSLIDGAIALPSCVEPVGVSVDADGFVWLPDKGADGVYKVDPSTHAAEFFGGLVSPYTYSDMTGSGLALVAIPPEG